MPIAHAAVASAASKLKGDADVAGAVSKLPDDFNDARRGGERGVRRYSVAAVFQSKKKGKSGPLTKIQAVTEEDEKAAQICVDRVQTVRSVYSSARRSLAKRKTMPSMPSSTNSSPDQKRKTMNAASQGQAPEERRLTLKLAAQAIQKGARDTILGRNVMSTFVKNVIDNHAEHQGLVSEMEKIEKQREEEEEMWRRQGARTVKAFSGKAAFLTSLLDELKALRTKEDDNSSAVMEELMANMHELMMKMDALKNMYMMDRRNTRALNAAIELCVADVQKRFENIGAMSKNLTEGVIGLGDGVAQQLEEATAKVVPDPRLLSPEIDAEAEAADAAHRLSLVKFETDAHDRQEAAQAAAAQPSGPSPEETPSEAPKRKTLATAGLWRKAAIIASFEKCLFGGTMQALQEAMKEVSQAAVETGHKPIEISLGDEPKKSKWQLAKKMSLKGDISGYDRSKRSAWPALKGLLDRSMNQSMMESLDEEPDSPPAIADTEGLSIVDTLGSERPFTPKVILREGHARRTPLEPFTYPAIGSKKVILPRNVEDVIFGRPGPGALEHRLMLPFPLIPLVPTVAHLPPLKTSRRARRAMKQRDAGRCTVEKVLAEREQRGLRFEDDELE